jgi:signal transduction histidine kinase
MLWAHIRRTAALTAAILCVSLALDYLVNVVIAPGLTPYTPFATMAIVLLVSPPFTFYLIRQRAKVALAEQAAANEQQARLAAEAISATKSLFLANVSHELRTPLSSIIGHGEVLLESAEEDGREPDRRDAYRLLGAARLLARLINELLELANTEAGKTVLNIAPYDPAALVHRVAGAARAEAEARGGALEALVDLRELEALGDESRIAQSLAYLLAHATQSMRRRVTLHARLIE